MRSVPGRQYTATGTSGEQRQTQFLQHSRLVYYAAGSSRACELRNGRDRPSDNVAGPSTTPMHRDFDLPLRGFNSAQGWLTGMTMAMTGTTAYPKPLLPTHRLPI